MGRVTVSNHHGTLKNITPATGGKIRDLPDCCQRALKWSWLVQLTCQEQICSNMGTARRVTEENGFIGIAMTIFLGVDVVINPLAHHLDVFCSSWMLYMRDQSMICNHDHNTSVGKEIANIGPALDPCVSSHNSITKDKPKSIRTFSLQPLSPEKKPPPCTKKSTDFLPCLELGTYTSRRWRSWVPYCRSLITFTPATGDP